MPGTIEVHWRRLRLPLAAFAVATLAGVAAAAAGWWHEHRILEGMNAAETRLAGARARYSVLAGEREQWRRFGPLYRQLAARGRLGEEQPARWTEAVRRAAATVSTARYRFGATHVAETVGPVEVRATDLSVDLEMRHEGELPRFLAALEREAPGAFTVSGCRLVRTDRPGGATGPWPGAAGPPPPATVDAACRIRWRSVVLAGVKPGWTPAAGPLGGGEAGTEPGQWRPAVAEPSREAFGRLFTSPAERARIDSALAAGRTETESKTRVPEVSRVRSESSPRPVRWVRVGGVVARSGRPVYAWVDGRRVAYGDSPPERPVPEGAGVPGVRLDAGGRSIVVRPGQRFDPDTGAVTDPIRRRKDRFGRDRSLRSSSRAPLTDSRFPEQN